jgi:hypothetical protein
LVVLATLAAAACETRETAIRDAGADDSAAGDGGGSDATLTHSCEPLCGLAHDRDPNCSVPLCVKHCVQDQQNASQHQCTDERNSFLDCAQADTSSP